MSALKTTSLGLLVVIVLVAGVSAMYEGDDDELKKFTFYPGIGYLQGVAKVSTWNEAFLDCDNRRGHLAIPNSEEEAEIYREIMAEMNTTTSSDSIVFIGFHDTFVNGDYETVADYPLARSGYTQWALGAPNVDPGYRCGGFGNDGLWNLNCSNQNEYAHICEMPLWTDYDFVPYLGYYKLHVDAKTWPEAWQACRDEGSHLAVINNATEYQALQSLFARHPFIGQADYDNYAWVGVHYIFGVFRNVVGTSFRLNQYQSWESSYPSLGINWGFTYVTLKRNAQLRMNPTSDRLAFFCEHELY